MNKKEDEKRFHSKNIIKDLIEVLIIFLKGILMGFVALAFFYFGSITIIEVLAQKITEMI